MKQFNARLQSRGQGGFTLIELLVVIAILGILAAVVVFAVGNTTDNAQVQACKTEKTTILTALEAYRASAGGAVYPATLATLVGTGLTNYLQSSPAGRWTDSNTPADPAGLTGVGVCTGI